MDAAVKLNCDEAEERLCLATQRRTVEVTIKGIEGRCEA